MMLRKYVNEFVIPNVGTEKKTISTKSASRWLKALDWIYFNVKKGVYVNGHERPNVVKYCQEFL